MVPPGRVLPTLPRLLLGSPGPGSLTGEQVGRLADLMPNTLTQTVVQVRVTLKSELMPYYNARGIVVVF